MFSNYFTLFKIKPAFNINFDELEKRYIELSKTNINEEESKDMKNINKAYQVLKSPLKRAEHLLNLFGTKNQENYTNPEILNESIKIREYLLNCDNLQLITQVINEKINDCTQNLINAFAIKNFKEAAMQVSRLKYLYKSLEEVKQSAAYSNF
ncbi:molecular chaperone Hsc20 [Wolbachia endosymbiont of Dipetalonema caudispina]|uniref:iron-sulfur cluster co-chaperone HscB C-terminal domain-containing protein n=1 Tax=Wolbachia endosymbiont of Dipetalonema caudispina TaxID=1812112 RepID=UPI00158E3435|nr:molecular chaperone Hsc20 [Wolbachia endosymbiont of Dipetalonema caudispina]